MDETHHRMRFTTSIRVMRVDRATGLETWRVSGIQRGGSIERNMDTTVTEQASLDLVGDALFGSDLLRIWADLTYADGTRESIPLGTFLPDGPKRTVNGTQGASSIPLTLYGRLRELSDAQFPGVYSVPAGTDPVTAAEGIIAEAGLTVAPHETCAYRLGASWTFGMDDSQSGESMLDAVNQLLDLAGWSAARTNPMGEVVLQPYVPPADKAPSWTFEEGPGARFLRSMTDEKDWMATANMVRAVYSTQDRDIIGVAIDDNPESQFSTVARGRIIAKTYEYSDVPEGMDDADVQAMADAKAAELLRTEQAVIHRVTMTHIHAPVTIGDVIHLDYPNGGIQGDYAVRTQRISLTAGLPVETELRAYVRSTL
ncbi:hypothetical protein [Bifidobacterium pullorum]|uniref:hypothetical protein n=1 Tax=Bifidobacterium pullorum TaxID=78448 RepID=UPI00243087F5|nr:hypothetical protein [Bifidobacterium pullorum]